MFFLQEEEQVPFVYVRTLNPTTNEPWVAVMGAHELVIKRDRDNDSALVLNRWSTTNNRSKAWARLLFLTWEGWLPHKIARKEAVQ